MQGYAIDDVGQGFSNPPIDNQRTFRAILMTMSRPGSVTVLGNWTQPPKKLHPATAAVCMTLVDMDTPLWLGKGTPRDVQTYLRFHCGCPVVRKQENGAFGLILDGTALPDMKGFNAGDLEYPDRSATVIIQVSAINVGTGVRLTGPGIKEETRLHVEGVDSEFWTLLKENNSRFPLGYDVILATPNEIVSLPRSVQVEV